MKDLNVFLKNMFQAINFENEVLLVEKGLLDSLDLFRLIPALEQEYKISISMEDISPENFNSVASIYSLICRMSNGDDK